MSDVKDIYLRELNDIRTRMQRRDRVFIICGGIVLVSFVIFLFVIFGRRSEVDQANMEQVRMLDSLLKYQAKHIETLERYNQRSDTILMQQELLRESLSRAYANNRPTEIRIINEYEKVPTTVRNLSKEQLRREVTGFRSP